MIRSLAQSVAITATLAVAGHADEQVRMHAQFIPGPTSWCAQQDGTPVRVTMDGLRVHTAASFTNPPEGKPIRVRRGSDVTLQDVPRLSEGARQFHGVVSSGAGEALNGNFVAEPIPLGTMQLEALYCDDFWNGHDPVAVTWTIQDEEGRIASSGKDWRGWKRLFAQSHFPRIVLADGTTFIVMDRPNVLRTTDAIAPEHEPD